LLADLGLRRPPGERLPQSMQGALRQAGEDAFVLEPIPETCPTEGLPIFGDEQRRHADCWHGIDRALKCRRYRNLRLFVRDQANWKLLGWANEPI